MDVLSWQSDIIEEEKDRLCSILKRNRDNLLNLNSNIKVITVIIKSEIE